MWNILQGGRWILTLQQKNSDLLDRCWMELAYALVGEQLDANDDICGAGNLKNKGVKHTDPKRMYLGD